MEASPLFNRPPASGVVRTRSAGNQEDDELRLLPDSQRNSATSPPLVPSSWSSPQQRSPHSASPHSGSRSNGGATLRIPAIQLPRPPPRSRSAESDISEGPYGAHSAPPRKMRTGADAEAPVTFWSFVGHQLLIGVDETVTAEMEDESARKRRKGVYHFLQAPWELEKLLLLGFLVCLDSFLFMVTMLPIRVLRAAFSLCVRRRLSWLQICDAMCVGAIVIAVVALGQIDTSQAYHSVKGQAVIKLYVVFNVLEVFDKLCASFGQDILHTLFWSSMTRQRWRGHLLVDFLIVAVYLVAHSFVLFYQVVSLNVAVNSHNNVMLTLLVSNNFVELKSNVFKRFEPENLFVLACSDMVERFQLAAFLLIVSLHVLSVQADSLALGNVLEAVAMVSAAELLVDWIKHAFVIKFNSIQPAVYRRFHAVLCRDLANSVTSGQEEWQAGPHMLQSAAAASTRIGFSCIPLLCLVVRSVGVFVHWLELTHSPSGIAILALGWALLLLLKLLLSVALTGYACEFVLSSAGPQQQQPMAHSAGAFDRSPQQGRRQRGLSQSATEASHARMQRLSASDADLDRPRSTHATLDASLSPARVQEASLGKSASPSAGRDVGSRVGRCSIPNDSPGLVWSDIGQSASAMLDTSLTPSSGIPSIESSAEL